ncbi:TetR family transcriptional regulator [Polymorphospora sp. NPDC050346]|uniref:TetR family transcriptional regulator n=1 Tax=Polymorphospora sp. NPDC050346 TaxID=3155780 RepID=UPI0033F7F0AF
MAETPDASKRDLLLAAALDEFAEHGGGGARIDRLAKRAGVSAGLVYSYFDGKNGLFEAVYDAIVDQTTEAVPFTGDDLPEYAGRLYDASLTHPAVLRFVSWYALERGSDDNVPEAVRASMRDKVAAVEDAQRRGAVTDRFTAGQLLALTLTAANMWQREGDGVRSLVPPELRRETVVAAVRTLTAPAVSGAVG